MTSEQTASNVVSDMTCLDENQCDSIEAEEFEQGLDVDTIVPNPDIKHPLQNRWALWFFKNDKSKDWASNLKLVTAFDTVEDFWALYNHIQPASKLPSGCDYSLFKDGIQPMWEDERNKRGGRWLINLNKNDRHQHLDNFWMETLLCLIGEAFDEHGEDVNGAVVNIRSKGDKLGVWTADAQRGEATKRIGTLKYRDLRFIDRHINILLRRKLKERLTVPSKIVIGFQAHSDTITKSGSTAKNRYTV